MTNILEEILPEIQKIDKDAKMIVLEGDEVIVLDDHNYILDYNYNKDREIIFEIKVVYSWYDKYTYCAVCDLESSKNHKDILDIIRSLYNCGKPESEKIHDDGWISVDDRLPENEDTVNVKYEAGVFGYGFYGNDTGEWYYDTDEDITMDAVAYWQPLPPAPEKE